MSPQRKIQLVLIPHSRQDSVAALREIASGLELRAVRHALLLLRYALAPLRLLRSGHRFMRDMCNPSVEPYKNKAKYFCAYVMSFIC